MKLIVINGPSGVGKSTIANRLHQEMPSSALIDVDELRRTLPNYREHREDSLRQAYVMTTDSIEEYLKAGRDVIVDKTVSSTEVVDSFVHAGRKQGAEVTEILLFADKATVLKRATDRGYKPGGLLTEDRVGELWEKLDTLRPQRPDAVIIDTSSLDPDEVFHEVRAVVMKDQGHSESSGVLY